MKIYDDVQSFSSTIKLDNAEMVAMWGTIPDRVVQYAAEKYVTENWPKLKKDKTFNKMVRTRAIELTAEKIANLLAEPAVKVATEMELH